LTAQRANRGTDEALPYRQTTGAGGIGAVGTVLVGVTLREQAMSPANLLALAGLVGSIVAVKLTAPH
jgi:hypothetical protein